ncbi:MAG: DegT/DnrJ/EryC1/StrS family aminotransferase [Candidatus Melainabacteria bacterium]
MVASVSKGERMKFKSPIRIPLSIPNLGPEEEASVLSVIRSGWVSSVSPVVRDFEKSFSQKTNALHAVATNNGTAAIHLAMLALGVDENDEVIVPALSFVATANPIRYVGATPVFVDVEGDTFGLDPDQLEAAITPRTKAIVATHLFGLPCRIREIVAIANRYGIPVIEDAAESLGTTIDGQYAGTFGSVGCFSFNGNKTITCGGGGMAVSNDPGLAEKMFHLSVQAREPGIEISHDEVGYNLRMTGLQAALGVTQIQKLAGFVDKKRRIARTYAQKLANIPGITTYVDGPFSDEASYWLSVILVDNPERRDQLIQRAIACGIEFRPVFKPLQLLKPYKQFSHNRTFPVAEKLWRQGVCLPSSTTLSEIEQQEIITLIQAQFGKKTGFLSGSRIQA